MRWLAEQFGVNRMLDAEVILPTAEFFPEPFERSYESVRALMDRLCGFMNVDSQNLALEICADDQLPGAAGHYDRSGPPIIRIRDSQLDDPERLVATLVHELSHEILLGGGLLQPTVADHEWVTDLLPVFLGVGIFGANATIRHEMKRTSGGSWWRIGKQGYLTSRIFGYAFALFAFMRGESKPVWAEYLRPDASVPLRDGLRFLKKSDDCLFHPTKPPPRKMAWSATNLTGDLAAASPTTRLSSLWELQDRPINEEGVISAVSNCLKDRDAAVAAAAAETLAVFGTAAAPTVAELVVALADSRDEVRASAARALGALRCESGRVVPELESLLEDPNSEVVVEAANAIRRFGKSAASCAPQVMIAFRKALTRGKHAIVDALARALVSITVNPADHVRDYFSDGDEELLHLALSLIDDRTERRSTTSSK